MLTDNKKDDNINNVAAKATSSPKKRQNEYQKVEENKWLTESN
jgi:hypothetical protein